MIWRLVATGLILAYALVAAASGLDRLTLKSPELAPLVPGLLAFDSHKVRTWAALGAGDAAGAEAAARRALSADPVDRRPAALLGAARWLQGDAQGAEAAYRAAAQFGWREPSTQRYWLEAAMEAGDYPMAALRLDAILRSDPRVDDADRLLAAYETGGGGRAALAARLALRPGWTDRFLSPGQDVPPMALASRAATVAALPALGVELDCRAVGRFSHLLLQRGSRPWAERVWNAHCGSAGGQSLVDPAFRGGAGGRFEDPFGWRFALAGDLSVELAPGGQGLVLKSGAAARRLALSQLVALQPGLYLLQAELRGAEGQPAPGQVIASLDCGEQPRPPSSPRGDLALSGQEIAATGCIRQVLGLWVLPGERNLELKSIRLIRR